jgi:pyruvate dehydrogenase E2 component (dihydrolipoamide acetyltransferase)
MARLEFRLPDIGEGLAEVEIVKWLVGVGDHIQENEPVAEVETDKAVVTMPAPATGTITQFLAQPGERIQVGSVLLVLDVADATRSAHAAPHASAPEAAAAAAREPAPSPPSTASVQAAPAARKLASELGLDLGQIRGTGPQRRVTVEDVKAHAAAGATAAADETASHARVERVPVRGVRRRIADAMTESVRAIPHVCGFHELDATALSAAYDRLKPGAATRGVRLTYLPFIVKAVATALVQCPYLNASFDEAEPAILLYTARNIGIATATPDGLLVPVIHNADRLGLLATAQEIERLSTAARARTLLPAELQHGTFTVTNVGAAGGWFGTSIIRYPEAAILGVGRIEPRAVVRDGQIVVRLILPLSLTFDHRVIDGDAALAFVRALRSDLESSNGPLFAAL